jgi:diaminohydroxyphosphoribosylaminopyrimidine deaminase/5-amino-6-(5-phosphoribosylamino)uracil reductase
MRFCDETAPRPRRMALQERGAEVVALAEVEPQRVLAELWARGIDGVLLEGGAHLAASFWEQDLVDALCFFVAPRLFGLGQPALAKGLETARNLVWQEPELVGPDLWLRGRVVR